MSEFLQTQATYEQLAEASWINEEVDRQKALNPDFSYQLLSDEAAAGLDGIRRIDEKHPDFIMLCVKTEAIIEETFPGTYLNMCQKIRGVQDIDDAKYVEVFGKNGDGPPAIYLPKFDIILLREKALDQTSKARFLDILVHEGIHSVAYRKHGQNETVCGMSRWRFNEQGGVEVTDYELDQQVTNYFVIQALRNYTRSSRLELPQELLPVKVWVDKVGEEVLRDAYFQGNIAQLVALTNHKNSGTYKRLSKAFGKKDYDEALNIAENIRRKELYGN